MYNQFTDKFVKLVYKDGKKDSKDYVRYVRGNVVSSDKSSLVVRLEKTRQLFAVGLPEIIYVKELRALKNNTEVRA